MPDNVGPADGLQSMPARQTSGIAKAYAWARNFKLAYFDFPAALAPIPSFLSQILFALICSVLAVLLRGLTDIWLPSAGPFALTIPTVLVATLFGRWQAGVISLIISSLYAWYFVLPIHASFAFQDSADGPRVLVNVTAGVFVVMLAEVFRKAVRKAFHDREILMVELQHRVKNNFASVTSLLRLQMRDAPDQVTRRAFQSAIGRIESFALANSYLYQGGEYSGTLDMRHYLKDLCTSLHNSLGTGSPIIMSCRSDPIRMPRDRAIMIGLLVNEVATNSFKHAFLGRKGGRIEVTLRNEPNAYLLTIADDGRGIPQDRRDGALGMTLIDSLAKQALATLDLETGENGTRFKFTIEPDD